MPQKLAFDEYVSIYSKVPRLCVDLILQKRSRILLAKRSIPPDIGWWHLPGGTVLMGERIEDTVHRVADEELGTTVTIIKSLGHLQYTKGSGFGFPLSIVFLVKPQNKITNGDQADEIKYFDTLPAKTLPEVKDFLHNVKSNLQL